MSRLTAGPCCFCEDTRTIRNQRRKEDSQPSSERLDYQGSEPCEDLYNLIPIKDHGIRIFELMPGSPQTPLAGQLFSATLVDTGGVRLDNTGDEREYIAISYHWGDEKAERYRIECNSTTHAVTLEAFRALHRIRHVSERTYVWIDSLCINQANNGEKNKQVAMMCDIYRGAKRLAAYLGESATLSTGSSNDSQDAAQFLLALLSDYRAGRSYLLVDSCSTTDCRAEARIDNMKYGAEMCMPHAGFLEGGLHQLVEIQWFERMWIKQEIWASASIVVHYGSLKMTWSALKAWGELYHSTLENVVPPAYQARITELANKLKRFLSPLDQASSEDYLCARERDLPNPFLDPENNLDFIHVHNKASVGRAACSDQKDRIYALLAMSTLGTARSSQPSESAFHVEWEESTVSTFIRLAEYIIRRDGSVFLLLLNEAFPRPLGAGVVEGVQLPSWVPDWRFDVGIAPRPKGKENEFLRSSRVRVSPSVRTQNRVLYVSGYCIGTVAVDLEPDFYADFRLQAWIKTFDTIGGRANEVIPWKAKDRIFILEGTRWPVVLRPQEGGSFVYEHIGPMFLNGVLGAYGSSIDVEDYLAREEMSHLSIV
jgi:hypothetical protein